MFLALTEDQQKLQQEYLDYQRKLEQQKEDYRKEHPDDVSFNYNTKTLYLQLPNNNYIETQNK